MPIIWVKKAYFGVKKVNETSGTHTWNVDEGYQSVYAKIVNLAPNMLLNRNNKVYVHSSYHWNSFDLYTPWSFMLHYWNESRFSEEKIVLYELFRLIPKVVMSLLKIRQTT